MHLEAPHWAQRFHSTLRPHERDLSDGFRRIIQQRLNEDLSYPVRSRPSANSRIRVSSICTSFVMRDLVDARSPHKDEEDHVPRRGVPAGGQRHGRKQVGHRSGEGVAADFSLPVRQRRRQHLRHKLGSRQSATSKTLGRRSANDVRLWLVDRAPPSHSTRWRSPCFRGTRCRHHTPIESLTR